MPIKTPVGIQELQTVFKKHFQDGLALAPSDYQKIATVVPTTAKVTTYGWLGSFPSMREWVGDRTFADMKASDYRIVTKNWESTVKVDKFDLDDDNLGIYSSLFKEEGLAAGRAPDELTFKALKDAHTAAGECYDGKPFFNDKHPVYPNVDGTGTAAEVTNNYNGTGAGSGTAWYLMDTSRSLKPLIFQEREKPTITNLTRADDESVFMRHEYRFGIHARHNVGFGFWQMAARSTQVLNQTNFENAYINMRKLRGDGGIVLDIRPTILLVPPSLYGKAMDIVGVQRNAAGADNPNYKRVQIIESAWLD